MEYNLGILPKQGNLQGAKKKIGNDWRIDLFLKTIDKYYRYNDEKILEQSKNRNNSDFTKNVLEYFSVPRYFDNGNNISSEIKDSQKIYNFCESFYGISCNMTKKLLLCPNDIEPKEYYNLIINFWNERKLKSRNKSVNKSWLLRGLRNYLQISKNLTAIKREGYSSESYELGYEIAERTNTKRKCL